jgi:hypothetical protein
VGYSLEVRCDYRDAAGVDCTHGYVVPVVRPLEPGTWARLEDRALADGWGLAPDRCPAHAALEGRLAAAASDAGRP